MGGRGWADGVELGGKWDNCNSIINKYIKKTSKLVNFCVAILILKVGENTEHFQCIFFCYFKKGKNANEMQKEICAVYREGAVTDGTCQKWFVKFCAGDFSLDDASQYGRATEFVVNKWRH